MVCTFARRGRAGRQRRSGLLRPSLRCGPCHDDAVDVLQFGQAAGVEIVDAEVGEQVTSLDMAGVSLTLTWVDEQLEALWFDPVDTPAFRRGAIEADYCTDALPREAQRVEVTEPGSPASQRLAGELARGFAAVTEVLRAAEAELGKLDSYAGDGDHGIGMVRGAEHARQAGDDLAQKQAGAGTLLTGAGAQWSTSAGGTSGALWGTFLSAIGAAFGDRDVPDARGVAAAGPVRWRSAPWGTPTPAPPR